MSRFFIEVSYLGTGYAGFQVQDNAPTVQGELERVMQIFFKKKVALTGSSRTDTGVHARQNFFHFDCDKKDGIDHRTVYGLNAMLPPGIAVRSIRMVEEGAHARFDAVGREYRYLVYAQKDPFLADRGYFFPFPVDLEKLQEAAEMLKGYQDYSAFAKRNSQVKTFDCDVSGSEWELEGSCLSYRVCANRFLRGMVRGLVGTMLQVGRGKIGVDDFRRIIEGGNNSRVDFSVPGRGLCLERVIFPAGYFGPGTL